MKRNKVSIGEKKGTSVFYSDTVTSSIGKEILAETPEVEYSPAKYNKQIALNNFKKKAHFWNKTTSFVHEKFKNQWIKDQIESLKGEILFLRQELPERNMPKKCKCIASTADNTELHPIDKGNNNDKRNYQC